MHDSPSPSKHCGAPPSIEVRRAERPRVLLCARTRLFSEALARVLRESADVSLVDFTHRTGQILPLVQQHDPDVVLLEVGGRRGLAAAERVLDAEPGTCIIALGVSDVEADIVAAAELGVGGYAQCNTGPDDLIATIKGVVRGELVCSPKIAAILNRRVTALATGRGYGPVPVLTPREREIGALIDEGLSNKRIAAKLGMRPSTVKNHVHHILEKLGVRRRGQAAAILRSNGALGEQPAPPQRTQAAGAPRLTRREREVAQLIDQNLTNREIADRLGISPATVKNHVHHILAKLDVRRRGRAAALLRATPPAGLTTESEPASPISTAR